MTTGTTLNSVRDLQRRLRGWLVVRGLAWLFAWTGAVAGAVLLADAAMDWGEPARRATPVALAAGILAGVVAIGLAARRLTPGRVARAAERACPALGDRLTNAVELAAITLPTGLGEHLRRAAVTLGEEAAAGLAAWPVARAATRRAGWALVIVAGAWLATLALEPELVTAVWPRFAAPAGDHPPFSRLRFAVRPAGAEVLYGGQVEVRASVTGRPVDRLWLATRGPDGETRTPMFRASDRTFFQTLVNVRAPAEYYVTDGRARSRRWPIAVRRTPQITLVEVAAEFPPHTGLPSRTLVLTDEPPAYPADTRLRLRVTSNRPLQEGTLTLTPLLGGAARTVTLTPTDDAHVVTGEWELTEAVAFVVTVRDTDGLASAEPRGGRFHVRPDERPRLIVVTPGCDAVATPHVRVPVRVQASDDHGITRVFWLRSHNRSGERPFALPGTTTAGARTVTADCELDLDQLGVEPGDVIEYYFEATDNWPRGPHVAVSKLYRVEVVSLAEYQRILRAMAARKALFEPYLVLDAWLRRLAKRTRAAEFALDRAGAAGEPAARRETEAILRDLLFYRVELAKLLATTPLFDIEQTFLVALRAVEDGTAWARDRLEDALDQGVTVARLGAVGDFLHELAQREDVAVAAPARQLATLARTLARLHELRRLARHQAEVAQMARRFADRSDLSRLEQLEVQEFAQQQRRIQEATHGALAALPALRDALPAEADFDALREQLDALLHRAEEIAVEPALATAAARLGAGDAVTGAPAAQAAADKLAELLALAAAAEQEGRNALPGGLAANSLEQILTALGAMDGPRDGYGLFQDNVALYGPNVEMAGTSASSGPTAMEGRGADTGRWRGETAAPATALPLVTAPPLRLWPEAKFPLRYRELVGEYFRALADEATEDQR